MDQQESLEAFREQMEMRSTTFLREIWRLPATDDWTKEKLQVIEDILKERGEDLSTKYKKKGVWKDKYLLPIGGIAVILACLFLAYDTAKKIIGSQVLREPYCVGFVITFTVIMLGGLLIDRISKLAGGKKIEATIRVFSPNVGGVILGFFFCFSMFFLFGYLHYKFGVPYTTSRIIGSLIFFFVLSFHSFLPRHLRRSMIWDSNHTYSSVLEKS